MTGQIIWAEWAYIDGTFQRDTGVYVDGDEIVAVGLYVTLLEQYPDATTVGGDGFILMPGFINSHDHGRALGTASLGTPDSFLEVWLLSLGTIPRLPPRLAAAYEGIQLIHSGVTATAHSHNPASFDVMFEEVPQTLQGYRDAGVRVGMHPPLVDQNTLIYDDKRVFLSGLPARLRETARVAMEPPTFTVDDYFSALDTLYAEHHDEENHRVHIQVSPAGGQWASDAFVQRAAEWAQTHQTRMQMHMLETNYQQEYAFRKWGKGFIRHLDDIGALGEWLTLAHMVWVEAGDAALLAKRGVSVAHNISSNLRLRSGIAPIPAFHEAGVRVGIGMDGHTLDDDQDFLREMRLAFTIANHPEASSTDILPLDMLRMGTRNGAQMTFGMDAPIGVLKAGHLADIVLLDWDAIKGAWCPPNFPAEAHLPEFFLRRATRHHVRDVMVHGEWVLRDGQHMLLDEGQINRELYDIFATQIPPEANPLAEYVRRHYAAWD